MTSTDSATQATSRSELLSRLIANVAADRNRQFANEEAAVTRQVFAYTKLSDWDLGWMRIGGPGLGNLLFPWARAAVGCRKHGLIPLAVTWPQLKVGPFLRHESDKRLYFRLFRAGPSDVRGIRRTLILAVAKKVDEKVFEEAPQSIGAGSVIVYAGMRDLFASILRDHAIVRDCLHRIVAQRHLARRSPELQCAIAVHVRLGDFQPSNREALRRGVDSTRIPISWYRSVLDQLRDAIPSATTAYVFSDGNDAELAPILARPGVRRAYFGSALADLLAMSQMQALVASGSTFSMWASYLGRMPVIWYPGQLKQRLYFEKPEAEVEVAEHDVLPHGFAAFLFGTTRHSATDDR